MQIICSLALIVMNGAYLFVSYNMDAMVVDEGEPAIEEVVTIFRPSMDLELADILDLDIFDFDVEELAASNIVLRSLATFIELKIAKSSTEAIDNRSRTE
jgi:hypothetical protein